MKRANLNNTARLAGLLYILLAITGYFGILHVPGTLIVPGNIEATSNNILANEFLFRLGIISALITQIIQVFLVLVLYKLLKTINNSLALLMVILILLAVPIAMLNELNNFAVLRIFDSIDYSQKQVVFFLDLHQDGIIIAQIFWGLWLFPLGYLVFKSGFIPKILGILLIIGSIGYVVDSFTLILYPEFGITVSEYTFLGELLFPLWLLIKGANQKEE